MKLLTTTLALTMIAGAATANPLDDFAVNGETDIFNTDLNFAMQGELDSHVNNLASTIDANTEAFNKRLNMAEIIADKNAEAVGATGIAMSMLQDGLSMSVGGYGNEKALAVGYSPILKGKQYKFGMSYDSRNTLGLGAGIKF